MKLAHSILEKPIEFEENIINVLVVENPKLFYTFVSDFYNQITNSNEGSFVLSDNSKILPMHKYMELILEPFSIDLNQKKILNKLYAVLKENILKTETYKELIELQSTVFKFVEKISDTIEYPLIYEDSSIDLQDIFKMVDLKLESKQESLLEKILDYITAVCEFLGINCFLAVNLKSYLSKEELEELYKSIHYKKLNLMLLESKNTEYISPVEKLYIIDSDLCSIF